MKLIDCVEKINEFISNRDITVYDINIEINNYHIKELERIEALEDIEIKKLNKSFEKQKNIIYKKYKKERERLNAEYQFLNNLKNNIYDMIKN